MKFVQRNETIPKHFKILIVDDDQGVLDLVGEALSRREFVILKAQSSAEAFDLLRVNSSQIACVISDFNMPGGSGFDLRQQMLENLSEIPFVIISGFITKDLALQAIDLKISAFMEKPFTVQELSETVTRVSANRIASLQDELELVTGFLEEARGLLEEMESIVLGFEDGSDQDSINRLFACAHTIKGTSGYFKPDSVHRFTHRFEDFITKFRGSAAGVDSEAASIMLKAIDVIRDLLGELEVGAGARDLDPLYTLFTKESGIPSAPKAHVGQAKVATPEQKVDELKVSVALLDSFMEKSGELTVLRNMVNKTLRVIETNYTQDPNIAILTELLSEMHKTNAHMQEQMSELRKISVRQIVKPLSRTIHDLSSQLKKKIKLETKGDDLRVDHSIGEVLSKCLIHIVRNSADHGLELPEERQAQGKSPTGVIEISAEQSGEFYHVSISDDGRGINLERVIKKVLENKLATQSELDRMTPSKIMEFIFQPGFSTAASVTDVSGRGVGTDMVKKSVEAVGGSIAIESSQGKGSRFTLTMPVPKSVLIVSSLLVQSANQTFALPQSAVKRVIGSTAGQIQQIKDQRFYCDDEGILPLIGLDDSLAMNRVDPERTREIVWVETKFGDLGLEVDAILDVEDIVVKKVAGWVDRLKVYSGATFLGDGRVGLVLDLEGIAAKLGLHDTRQSENIDSTVEKTVDQVTQSLLLFGDKGSTIFAVDQSELFRLEEFRPSDMQFIGNSSAVLFRNKAMALLKLDGSALERQLASDEGLPLSVIVVEVDASCVGFVVDKIIGFTELARNCQLGELQLNAPIIVDEKIVKLISLFEIAKRRSSESSAVLQQSA